MENLSRNNENINKEEQSPGVEISKKLEALINSDSGFNSEEEHIEAKEFFNSLAPNLKKLPEVRETISEKFAQVLFAYYGGIDKAKIIADTFDLSEYEKTKIVSDRFLIGKIRTAYFWDTGTQAELLNIKDSFGIPEDIIKESVYNDIKKESILYNKEVIEGLIKTFGIDKQRIKESKEILFNNIVDRMEKYDLSDQDFQSGHVNNPLNKSLTDFRFLVQEEFKPSNEIIYPATISLVEKCLVEKPEKEFFIEKILEATQIPKDLLKDPKISEPRYSEIVKNIEKWYSDLNNTERIIGELNEYSELIPLPDEFYSREELRKWIEISVCALLKYHLEYNIDTLAKSAVPREIIAKAIAKDMIENKTEKYPLNKDLVTLLEKVQISTEIKNEAAKEMVIKALLTADTDTLDYVQKHITTFSAIEIEQFCREAFQKTNDFRHKKILNEYVGGTIDLMLTKTVGLFGDFASESNYNLLTALHTGVLDDNAKQFGISKTGQEGMIQLERRLQTFKGEILEKDFDSKILENSIIARDFFKSYTRYEGSQFGSHDDESLSIALDAYKHNKENNISSELNPAFIPSGEIKIASIDKEAQENFTWGEHFLPRYSVLVEDIQKSIILDKEKFPITKLIDELEEKRGKLLENLTNKLEKMENGKGSTVISSRIKDLESTNLRSLNDFQKNFLTLSSFKEFHTELRRIMFLWSIAKNRANINETLSGIQSEHPSVDDVSNVIDFIDHITNQETMAKYFTDKQSKKVFEKLTSTVALQEELSRAQNQDTKGTKSLEFIPTKGLLMELSGHIADACWADQYNIAKEFPNVTATIFIQNRNTKFERIAGASLQIEARSKNGDDLLIIRGLNPLQNIINELSVEDFYHKYTSYLKQTAEKMGKKLAIVIDDYCGGASTNRPVLYNYLQTRELKKVILDPNDKTEFNGYNIIHNCFLVE